MKKLFLSVIVTLFMSTAFAANKSPNTAKNFDETYRELTKMLNTYPNFGGLDQDVVVKVKIAINEKHEIVVLNTNTTNEELNYYIKNTLNYQKLLADELEVGKGLVFLVKFTK
ncbi:hypothetical protein SAMN05443543_10964 [Flavobacterium flevense]|uniref:TonB C-terminal domain-containing protein n=1 Tax=Flavobacterium flevense TaxID=983 RepID=A0A4Y4AXL7_9FLAO|nr:hypothetical protein [Flavobacterium flevense]GEC71334.1 hypothetical protein FFL01_08730 [Flavobacterium flevense]SHM03619.1 hypothetical protein SAMN05443543_10964 [Flavobacterium flevense]